MLKVRNQTVAFDIGIRVREPFPRAWREQLDFVVPVITGHNIVPIHLREHCGSSDSHFLRQRFRETVLAPPVQTAARVFPVLCKTVIITDPASHLS